MSGHRPTPEPMKQKYSGNIARYDTFRPIGVSEFEARMFLDSPNGKRLLGLLEQANPSTPVKKIRERATEQVMSGKDIPQFITLNEPLVKIVPAGTKPTSYSAYFTRLSEIENAFRSGHSLADYFGLPIASEANRYDVYVIHPRQPTEVLVSRVAETSELAGMLRRRGGAEQIIVPDRHQFHDAAVHALDRNDNLTALVGRVSHAQAQHLSDLTQGAIKGVSAAGAATVVYEAADTTMKVARLSRDRNLVGVQSHIVHVGGSHAGAMAGAMMGARLGATTGPGMGKVVTTALGAIVGAIGGEVLADSADHLRIYRQRGSDGHNWHFDPATGWTRSETRLDPHGTTFRAQGVPLATETFTADAHLADELNFKASSTAAQLRLAEPARPQSPFSLTASATDTPSAIASPWERQHGTGDWSRRVVDQVLEHGLKSTQVETASPARAAELNRQAEEVIAQNLAQTPSGVAERFVEAYEAYGWETHGPIPDAITRVQNAQHTLLASDGRTYALGHDSAWTTAGMFGQISAEPSIRAELDATWELRQRARQGERLIEASAPHENTPRRAPGPREPSSPPSARPVSDFEAHVDHMLAAAKAGDWDAFDKGTQVLANSPAGREVVTQAQMLLDAEDRLVAEHRRELQAKDEELQAMQERMQSMIQQQGHQHTRGMSR